MKLFKMLKRSALALFAVFILASFMVPPVAYASKTLYYRDGLIGGTATDLDAQDGTVLTEGDFAYVMDGTDIYHYRLDATSGAAESSPVVISPDTNAGTKRWILQNVYNVTSGVSPPSGVEITGNIAGMILSNSVDADHDISISAGACFDSTNTYQMIGSSAVVKQIDAVWTAGTAAGGLLYGSVTADFLYNIYALRKDSDGTVDYGFLGYYQTIDTKLPTGYSHYRWIGFVVTDASANIRTFTHTRGDVIEFNAAFEILTDVSTTVLTPQDIIAYAPYYRTASVKIGVNDCPNATTPYVYFSASVFEASTPVFLFSAAYPSVVGTTWAHTLAAGGVVDVDLHSSGNLYMYTAGLPVDVWLKSVKIIR